MKPQTVLLINPCATYSNEIAQKCYPPLNLLYLARALLRAGVQVHVLDANALALPRDQTVALARQLRPDLVGIPLYTEILSSVHRLAQSLREALPETRLVLGGARLIGTNPDLCFGQNNKSLSVGPFFRISPIVPIWIARIDTALVEARLAFPSTPVPQPGPWRY